MSQSEGSEQSTQPCGGARVETGSVPSTRGENQQRKERKSGALRRFLMGCLYVVFLVAVVVGCLAGVEYWAYRQLKASPYGGPYKDRGMDRVRLSSQTVAPQFGYEPTPGFATIRNTRLGNSYEFINDQGFKDFKDLPLEKPDDEYRVFVTGGSVVFGRGPVGLADEVAEHYEVTFRWNIPHIMEQLLNADERIREKIGGKKIRVINAGVAGYVIQNDLMRYLAKLRLYKPDLIVSLDGANEVHTVARPLRDWNYFTEGPYYEVISEVMDMSRRGMMNYLWLWFKRNTYFFTWLALRGGEGTGILMENRGFAAHPQDPTPEMLEYREKNIAQVADVLAIYHKTLEIDRVPHVFALQPMFRNSKKKRTPMEQKIEQVTGMEKIGFYEAAETFDLLVDRVKKRGAQAGIDVVDLTKIFDDVQGWVFTDWCHLTNGANYILAKELVNQVKTRIFGLPLLPDDPLKPPLDSYLYDYAKRAVVLVDNRPTDQGLRILKGYPGPEVLEVGSAAGANPSGIVVDLGEVLPVSRLRIVWADEQSVPKAWEMELSEDSRAWKKWFGVNDTQTDGYDQWPGFEYYDVADKSARYVRYSVPDQGDKQQIRLRQLSLFR